MSFLTRFYFGSERQILGLESGSVYSSTLAVREDKNLDSLNFAGPSIRTSFFLKCAGIEIPGVMVKPSLAIDQVSDGSFRIRRLSRPDEIMGFPQILLTKS
jgi:hypothetical protein